MSARLESGWEDLEMKKPSNVYSRDVIRLIIKNQDRHNIPRSIIERLAKSKTRPIPMKNKGKA